MRVKAMLFLLAGFMFLTAAYTPPAPDVGYLGKANREEMKKAVLAPAASFAVSDQQVLGNVPGTSLALAHKSGPAGCPNCHYVDKSAVTALYQPFDHGLPLKEALSCI